MSSKVLSSSVKGRSSLVLDKTTVATVEPDRSHEQRGRRSRGEGGGRRDACEWPIDAIVFDNNHALQSRRGGTKGIIGTLFKPAGKHQTS